jgi:hypothetical protein
MSSKDFRVREDDEADLKKCNKKCHLGDKFATVVGADMAGNAATLDEYIARDVDNS